MIEFISKCAPICIFYQEIQMLLNNKITYKQRECTITEILKNNYQYLLYDYENKVRDAWDYLFKNK